MGRLNVFEIEDFAWCPKFIRESTTDILLALYKLLRVYEPAFEKINEILEKTGSNAIIDCCSGSGGPIKQLHSYLTKSKKKNIKITLTDKFPNINLYQHLEEHYPGEITGCKDSLDAAKLPSSLKGMRTLFSSFHHFSPESALKILQNAVDNNAPIGIFEAVSRSPSEFLRAFFSFFMVPLIIPFSKRLTWRKFFFTYIIPIVPFTFTFDYIMSNLRSYSTKEMHALINKLDAPGYKWEVGRLWSKGAKCYIPYLIGYKAS